MSRARLFKQRVFQSLENNRIFWDCHVGLGLQTAKEGIPFVCVWYHSGQEFLLLFLRAVQVLKRSESQMSHCRLLSRRFLPQTGRQTLTRVMLFIFSAPSRVSLISDEV